MVGNNRVPKEWIDCPRSANDLIAQLFFPLKTPLSHAFDNKLPEDKRYYPKTIFELAKTNNVEFGLWIDLTMTDRYYNRKEVEEMNCEYVKFAVKGHGDCPSRKEVASFINLVENFILRAPERSIAIHCTHGFNRTGFLICCYLVEKLEMNINDAVQAFAAVRPPGIYRANYIKELFTRYGDLSQMPPPPTLPAWVEREDYGKERRRYDRRMNNNRNRNNLDRQRNQIGHWRDRFGHERNPHGYHRNHPGVARNRYGKESNIFRRAQDDRNPVVVDNWRER